MSAMSDHAPGAAPLPIVASLWIGGRLSFLEQLCLKSFVDHGHRVILYTYGAVAGVPAGVEVLEAERIYPADSYIRHRRTGSPAVHADAFRYRMIEVQNVIWVDADMLCMKPWDFADQWVFGWEKTGQRVCNAVLGLPRFSKTLARLNAFCQDEYPIPPWAGAAEHARLSAARDAGRPVHVSDLEWGVWGPAALTYFLNQTGEMAHALPEEAFYPVPFAKRREMLKPGVDIEATLGPGTYGVHLWNRRLRRRILMHDRGQVAPDSFLGRALARHGVDPAAAPIEDDLAAYQAEEAAKAAPAAAAPVATAAAPTDSATDSVTDGATDDLPAVASLWIGGTLSFLEQLCLQSFVDHGHKTILYTYGAVDKVPGSIEVRDANAVFPKGDYIKHKESGSPALHSDVFRYHMIAREGLVWVDADVLCMQPWRFDTPFVYGWEKPDKLICGAVLGFPPESRTLKALIAFCADEYPIPPWLPEDEIARLEGLRAAGTPEHVTVLPWGVWGPAALTHFLKETGEIEHAMPRKAFYPISFKNRRELLDPGTDVAAGLGAGCYGVHLWNRRIRRRIVTHEGGVPHPASFLGRALARHRIDPHAAPIPDEPPAHILAARAAAAEAKGKADDKAPGAGDQTGTPPQQNPNVTFTPPPALAAMPIARLTQSPEEQRRIDELEERTGPKTGWLKSPEAPIPNDKILIVTSMKNEAPFILDWVAHHLGIGATHFLVYTNDCTDNTNAILDRLQALGHVTRRDNPWDPASGKKPQHAALKDAVEQPCYAQADWILTIDVDEFVNIHVGDGTFSDFLRAANYPNVVSFTWKFFGNTGVDVYEDRPVTELFTRCAPEFIPKPRLGWGFKSMFHRTSPYTRIGVHRPLGIDAARVDEVRWVNGSGRAMPDMLLTNNGWRSTKRSLGYRLATLNHYILRSAESFLVKRERGRINHTEHDQGIDYWARRNYTTETDDRILARAPITGAIRARLATDPDLARLHDQAVAWHKGRIAHLMAQPDYRDLYRDLTRGDRPDALFITEKDADESASPEEDGPQDAAPKTAPAPAPKTAAAAGRALRPAAPLTDLRMVSAPASAAEAPVHDRFRDAAAFARKAQGFLWEGPENALMFVPKSRRLVVAFDNLSVVKTDEQRWPWGFKVLSQDMGCSVLGVMAVQRNWFRAEFVHDAFDSLRDQGFFQQFDEVLFYGTSMGGFAALVYQQCAPGANVLAIAPQSTLNRAILPDDDRWGWTARLDWTGRYNDAAGATARAGNVFVIADPYYDPDARQVARLRGDNVTWLRTPFMGHQLPNAFLNMGVLKDLLTAAVAGTLDKPLFYKMFRARRDLARFQHDILMEAEKRGKIRSAIRVCEYTLRKRDAGNIRRTMRRLKSELAETAKAAE